MVNKIGTIIACPKLMMTLEAEPVYSIDEWVALEVALELVIVDVMKDESVGSCAETEVIVVACVESETDAVAEVLLLMTSLFVAEFDSFWDPDLLEFSAISRLLDSFVRIDCTWSIEETACSVGFVDGEACSVGLAELSELFDSTALFEMVEVEAVTFTSDEIKILSTKDKVSESPKSAEIVGLSETEDCCGSRDLESWTESL